MLVSRVLRATKRVQFEPSPTGPWTMENASKWTATLAGWGGVAGAGILLFGQSIPRFRRDILEKVPVLGDYYIDKTPASDKPF